MRPFETASGTTSAQSQTLSRRPGARWASPIVAGIFAGILASVVLSSSAVGQQSQSGSGQFRKRSTTGTGTSSAIDPKLKGFLEQQAGIDQNQPLEETQDRSQRGQIRPVERSSETRRRLPQNSASSHSARSTTAVSGSRIANHTNEHADVQNTSRESDKSSPGIEHAAWEPKSDTDSAGSSATGSTLSGLSQSEAVSELQPTPATTSEQKPAEISVPLESSGDAVMFLDLRDETKPDRSSAPIGERGAEVSVVTSPVQVLSRAVAWIVIALCLFSLAALGVRRWQRQRGLLPTPGSRSRVLETLSLGPGRSVSLIEMAGHRALVAFDAGGIKQLVLTPPSFQDELTEADEPLIYERPAKTRTDLTLLTPESQS